MTKLSKIFNDNMKHVILKGIETASGYFDIYPDDDTNCICFGICGGNYGYVAKNEDCLEYDFDMSWDYNIQGMIETILEKYGYIE